MSDGFIPCKESRTLNGVRVSCDKRQLPNHNIHHCPTWNVVWRHGDTPPQRASRRKVAVCGDGCELPPRHKGPHGTTPALW